MARATRTFVSLEKMQVLASFGIVVAVAAFGVAAANNPPPAEWAPGDPHHVGNYSPTTGIGAPYTKGMTITGEAEVISSRGVEQSVWVYKPAGKGPFPVVLLSSGGSDKGMPETMEWLASRLQAAGVASIIPTWRADNPKDDPLDMMVDVDWLEKQSWVNKHEIGLYGHSRGGNGAYREAALDPRIKVLVIMGGLVELSMGKQLPKDSPMYAMMVKWLGDPDKDPEGFKHMEAINFVSQIKQPTLIIQGEIDTHVPRLHAEKAKAGILAGGNPNVTLVLIPNMGHFAEIGPFNRAGGNVYAYDQLANIIIPYFRENLKEQGTKILANQSRND